MNLALEGFCGDISARTRLPIRYTGVDLPGLPDAIQICLYRFLQEALTNVIRHAHAQHVWVDLLAEGRQVVLSVKDDGIGFPTPETAGAPGLGLLGLRERLGMLGGRLEIVSRPAGGACLTAWIPFEGL